jgi:hypothetical protein
MCLFNMKRGHNHLLTFFCLLIFEPLTAQMELLPRGAFIIKMDATPMTVNNSLKPYGLIYELLSKKQIPIKWVIKPNKQKDSADFFYNNVPYRSSAFIIEAAYRTPSVDSIILAWQGRGVVGTTTTSPVNVPVFRTISYSIKWTLDDRNGQIAENYLKSAGIPTTAYDWVAPSALGCCNDVFVMPHADPLWSTHQNLLTWNGRVTAGGCRGAIWAGCNAVSHLENLANPATPNQPMSFLMNNPIPPSVQSAVPDDSHTDGTPPYAYFYADHPVMQFVGIIDAATQNGAEQVYMPRANGWRSTTQLGVIDPTHPNIPSLSLGPAAILAFGSGKGDSLRGKVLYSASHQLDRATAVDNLNAQKAFFNFSFWAAGDNAIYVDNNIPDQLFVDSTYIFIASATGGTGAYRYEWTASCAGIFSNPTGATTTFRPRYIADSCIITCKVWDACNTRLGFKKTFVDYVCPNSLMVSLNSSSDTVCLGGNTVLTATVGNSFGTLTYQWQQSSNGASWTNITNANAATYTVPADEVGTRYYRVLVTATVGGLCNDDSEEKPVTVVRKPTVSVVVTTDTICVGGNSQLTAIKLGGVSNCTFQWQVHNGSSWININGANNNTYTTNILTATTHFRAQINCATSGCCN